MFPVRRNMSGHVNSLTSVLKAELSCMRGFIFYGPCKFTIFLTTEHQGARSWTTSNTSTTCFHKIRFKLYLAHICTLISLFQIMTEECTDRYHYNFTISLICVSVLRGTSWRSKTDTLRQQAQQNELPDEKFKVTCCSLS